MKNLLIAVTAAALPLLAQSPDDVISRLVQLGAPGMNSISISVPFGINTGALQIGNVIVKNAPYSADAVTETTQALTDGNRIVQRTTQKLYRDSDGRERREESLLAVGALAQPDASHVITISDPVENVSYSLNASDRTARKSPRFGALLNTVLNDAARRVTLYSSSFGELLFDTGAAVPGTSQPAKEDLGMKSIEGVNAHGTRSTQTIPAGKIGNQLPINIVDEVWFSPDLQMNVMTSHNDPRSGETVYKLSNIVRANPPMSLFEPPPDYTVIGPGTGTGIGRGRGMGIGAGRGAGAGSQK
jgi:hypothetical protein